MCRSKVEQNLIKQLIINNDPHIYCLNPASKTGKKTDGERWQKREANGSFKTIYYVKP